eukprot:403353912
MHPHQMMSAFNPLYGAPNTMPNQQLGSPDQQQSSLPKQQQSQYNIATLNTFQVQSILEENKSMMLKCLEDMNNDKAEDLDCFKLVEKLHQNLVFLAGAADLQSNSRFVLRENRELISKEDLQDFYQKFPLQDSLFMKERPKQVKIPWTDEEQLLFIEGLELHGAKIQVRSHLQKHLIKETKRKQYPNNFYQVMGMSSNSSAGSHRNNQQQDYLDKENNQASVQNTGDRAISAQQQLQQSQSNILGFTQTDSEEEMSESQESHVSKDLPNKKELQIQKEDKQVNQKQHQQSMLGLLKGIAQIAVQSQQQQQILKDKKQSVLKQTIQTTNNNTAAQSKISTRQETRSQTKPQSGLKNNPPIQQSGDTKKQHLSSHSKSIKKGNSAKKKQIGGQQSAKHLKSLTSSAKKFKDKINK